MAIVVKPLTDTEIKKFKHNPEKKINKLSDGQGLFLIIQKNGTKYFRFDYKFNDKRKSMSFGVYPDITLKKARELREKNRKLIKEDTDPLEDKHKDKNIITFKKIAEDWLQVMKAEWKEITYKKASGTIFNNTIPIQNKDIKTIKRVDILNLLKVMEQRGVLESADRLLTNLNRIYKYAVTYNYVEHNIIADIDKKNVLMKPKKNHFPAITDELELKELIIDINSYGIHYKADISTIYALKLAPYVFLRPFNLRGLEWKEVNLDNDYLEINESKMKTGKRFILPLSSAAKNILLEIKPYSSDRSKFVFPSPTSNLKPISDATLNHALMKLGYKDKHTTHGFRATFSTLSHEKIKEHGLSSDIIESCLAHEERNKIKAAYNRDSKMKYFEEKKELIQWWENCLNYVIANKN